MSVCAPRSEPDAPATATDILRDPDPVNHIPFPEENDNLHNYRDELRYADFHEKKLSKFDVSTPSRARILELLRPTDPGRESLEDIVRPLPRRGLIRPYDEDTRRFLQRVLFNPTGVPFSSALDSRLQSEFEEKPDNSEEKKNGDSKHERSLADELREAEEEEKSGNLRRDLLREFRKRGGGARESMERDRLGKLALSVEQDEENEDVDLTAAARRLDALLAESRNLHEELAGIHEDIQAESARACRCAEIARALTAESRAVRYLDDVVALLRGDVSSVVRTRDWPFAFGHRHPERNYIV